MNRLSVLALSPVPYEGAGCRFRIAQFIPYLATQGIDVTVAPFYDREFFNLVYRPGHQARKAVLLLKQTAARLSAVVGAGRYDAVFIYREAFPIGPPVLEALLSAFGLPLVYDFDDAVFLSNTSEANRYLGAVKFPNKTGFIIRRCQEVIAGNEYLATYARGYNRSVHVVPTAVDTELFVPRRERPPANQRSVVGWIGTPTTAAYLAPLHIPLAALADEHTFVFRVAGNASAVNIPGVNIEPVEWSVEREVDLFNTCDVGVYPLPDDEWAKGKCGFKAIQFMACGVPVVASPVGVNREIIQDGANGFLAATASEWRDKIDRLLCSVELRRSMGAAGRRTIEQRFSLRVNAPRIAGIIRRAAERRRIVEPLTSAAGDHRG